MTYKTEPHNRKVWLLKEDTSPIAAEEKQNIVRTLGVHEIIARLLHTRGYRTPEEARAFLCMESELLCDPFDLTDMRQAVERIRSAVENGERITIYGDYDVDGVTAVCTLYLYLRELGANVSYYIPNRSGEGYGLSCNAIDTLAGQGTTLLVTVDTGITANEEIAYAATVGMDVVVTDHHECRSELPAAVAVVNPHRPDSTYPFPELAGVGVVFKLLCAYEESCTGDPRIACVDRICRSYADLVSIGTIADVMPIAGENKLIVKYGLQMIEHNRRMGISALMDAAQRPHGEGNRTARKVNKITSGYIGYTLAPRLNAAGRIRSATLAVELFLAETRAEADRLAQELCNANRERQEEENRIMKEAYEKIEREHDFENDPVIVLDADTWHHGVIGIVASRITECYGLPAILVSFEGCDVGDPSPSDVGKGSGRSIKGMNLVDALVHCSDHLVKFGGHELAAGLSVTRGELPAFRAAINEYARSALSEEALVATLEADCALEGKDLNMTVAQQLQLLEPFGVGNPVPVFTWQGAIVQECVPVSGGKHTRLVLTDSTGVALTAMCFSSSPAQLNLFVSDVVDVMFNLDINEYMGRKSVQLIVRDIRLSECDARVRREESDRFAAIWAGDSFTAEENVLPTREDFAAVYRLVRTAVRGGIDVLSHRAILAKLAAADVQNIGYVKLKIIIRVLQELNLLGIEETQEEVYRFRLHFSSDKTDLDKSNLLRRLRNQQRA